MKRRLIPLILLLASPAVAAPRADAHSSTSGGPKRPLCRAVAR
jgi:hypothetical protein